MLILKKCNLCESKGEALAYFKTNLRFGMKHCFLYAFLLMLLFFSHETRMYASHSGVPLFTDSVSIRAASYNIRVDAKMDQETGNSWDKRKEPLAKVILNHDFDIVGTQEGSFEQMDGLMALLPGYDFVGYPYAGPEGKSHTASIIFKKDLFEILDKGVFWYSETPDEKSLGWDADDTRICSWVRAEHKLSGQVFYFFTSHFYWRYRYARENSGKVFVRKMNEIVKGNVPVISTGDFNSEPSSTQVNDMLDVLQDAFVITESSPVGPEYTNLGGGNFQGEPKNRIDYIFVNEKIKVLTYSVLTDTYGDNRYPSDHFPVVCDVLFTGP